jgi:hypothetical protein
MRGTRSASSAERAATHDALRGGTKRLARDVLFMALSMQRVLVGDTR